MTEMRPFSVLRGELEQQPDLAAAAKDRLDLELTLGPELTGWTHTANGRGQTRSDGQTVWCDVGGFTVGRFSRFGVDLHTEDASGCIHCTHEKPGAAEWDDFVRGMFIHHAIEVPDAHRPRWLPGAAREITDHWPEPWAGWSWLGQVTMQTKDGRLVAVAAGTNVELERINDLPDPFALDTLRLIIDPLKVSIGPLLIGKSELLAADHWVVRCSRGEGFVAIEAGRLTDVTYAGGDRWTMTLSEYHGSIYTTPGPLPAELAEGPS